jgi:hypothetical protein
LYRDFRQPGSEVFSLTAEQLEASRSERMRHNGRGQLTFEEARTWLEETGLCLFLPRRQFSSFVAPSFVEAVGGERNATPSAKIVSLAEELLIRLELEGVAVRLNLLGQPGEQPDFVVASWVLPYVYALRGDRDWRRIPQLTGSRQVSPLAVQVYKLLDQGDATISQLKHGLGREATESAVLRGITELWQQLRIVPVVEAPGKAAKWQLLRLRFQKAIAEGASTSQVTAISVLASIYLQAVIAASMEEVELFLAPLTARSKVREVLRGLLATRQVHTISLGHAPQFYVAGTLPEFATAPTIYASSSMPASTNFLRSYEHEVESRPYLAPPITYTFHSTPITPRKPVEPVVTASDPAQKPALEKPAFDQSPRGNHQGPESASGQSRAVRDEMRSEVRNATARPNEQAGSRHVASRHHASSARWQQSAAKKGPSRNGHSANGHSGNGHGAKRHAANGHATNGHSANGHSGRNGKSPGNGFRAKDNGHASRKQSGAQGLRKAKASTVRPLRNVHAAAANPSAKSSSRQASRPVSKHAGSSRKDMRTGKPAARGNRKLMLSAASKAGSRGRFGFTAPLRKSSKKRG